MRRSLVGVVNLAQRHATSKRRRPATGLVARVPPPAPASAPDADPWKPVRDKATGLVYYWNTQTDETTALGAPKPIVGALAANPERPGFMSMVAEGLAFGTGMHLAGRAVSSILGGGSSAGEGASGGGGGDNGGGDDEWDV
jgi:hypothetical protein